MPPTKPDRARCTGTTKKGTPCSRYALDGHDVCLAHAPKEVRDSKGFGGSQPGAGRPPMPRVVDVIKERVEAQADAILGVLFDALEADRGLALMVKGGGMEIAYIPDHEVRMRAVKELLDRAYGRPKQQTEITGADGGPVEMVSVARDPEHAGRVAALLGGIRADG